MEPTGRLRNFLKHGSGMPITGGNTPTADKESAQPRQGCRRVHTKLNVKRSRVLGFIVIAAGAAAVWWGAASGARTSTAVAYHGGQLVASIRSEPRSFNRLVKRDSTTELLNMLMQGSLVRINRATFDLEPWLAEKWESSADGRQYTLHLRRDVTWSDGAPFTSTDVLFSLQAVFDPRVESVLASVL